MKSYRIVAPTRSSTPERCARDHDKLFIYEQNALKALREHPAGECRCTVVEKQEDD